MLDRDDQFLEPPVDRADQGRTLDALLSAQMIGPDAPLDYRLIADAMSGPAQPGRWEPRHARPSPLVAMIGLNAVTAAFVGVLSLGGLTAAAYAGALPDMAQRIAHDLIFAPDAQRDGNPHRSNVGPQSSAPTSDAPTVPSPADTSAATPPSSHPTPTPTPTSPAPAAPALTPAAPAPTTPVATTAPTKTHPGNKPSTHPPRPTHIGDG